MPSLRRRLSPWLTVALTHPGIRRVRRGMAELRRRAASEPHRVLWFHQTDDPYSHLLAQVVPALLDRYEIELQVELVGPPPDDAAPERESLQHYALRDAVAIAPAYGLGFPQGSALPTAGQTARAGALLAGALDAPTRSFAELAQQVGDALFRGDDEALAHLAKEHVPVGEDALHAAMARGDALRKRLGHYLGAMLFYGGEWYWGVDRLQHLERRLQELSLRREGSPQGPVARRPDPGAQPPVFGDQRFVLEYFPSLRSPYTAIAMQRVLALPSRLPVELVLRPVLPMVMRGLPVPREKQLYILQDTKREAEEVGVPFGRLCDPVGRPVERAFSLFSFARQEGRAGPFLHSFTRAAFEEGVDTGTDAGLQRVVERAGLSWSRARRHLDRDGWQQELEANRAAMFESGLWGVPSFRLFDSEGRLLLATWGQDRIWLVEAEVRRQISSA